MAIQLSEGKKVLVSYIADFPPDEAWEAVKALLKPETANGVKNYYFWIGEYLDSFLQKRGNPLSNSSLEEELQHYIQSKATHLLLQANLLFQAEEYIKHEARKKGISYPWQTWVDLEKRLIIEDFLCLVVTYNENFWESLPAQTHNKSLRDEIRYQSGKLTKKDYRNNQQKLNKAKAKLKNSPEYDEKLTRYAFWSTFCQSVFEKYKKQLPGYIPWLTSQEIELPNKYALNDGAFVNYPGRGQGKKQI